MLAAQAQTLGLPFEQPTAEQVDPEAFGLLPPEYIRKHGVAPLRFEADRLVVATTDPNNIFLLDEVRRKTGKPLTTVVTPAADIHRLIEQMTSDAVDFHVDQIIKEAARDDAQSFPRLQRGSDRPGKTGQ